MNEAKEIACPECGGILEVIEYPSDSMLNRHQWEASIAGDCYCTKCKSEAAATGYRYYWQSKLAGGREQEAVPSGGTQAGSFQRMVRATNQKLSDQAYCEYVTDCQNGYGHLWRNK